LIYNIYCQNIILALLIWPVCSAMRSLLLESHFPAIQITPRGIVVTLSIMMLSMRRNRDEDN